MIRVVLAAVGILLSLAGTFSGNMTIMEGGIVFMVSFLILLLGLFAMESRGQLT